MNNKLTHAIKKALPNVMLLNARSIINKTAELSIIVDKHNSDIIFATETWLNENVPSEVVNIPGLIVIRKDRSSGRGGGIAIYIKDNVPVKTRYDLCDPCFECLWITLRPKWLPRSISRIAAACVYLPPNMLSCDLEKF